MIALFLGKRRICNVFLLQTPNESINFFVIVRIKKCIFRYAKVCAEVFCAGKMQITVGKTVDSLIILWGIRRVEDAGIFTAEHKTFVQIKFHRCFQEQKQIVAASTRAIDACLRGIASIVFTKIDAKKRGIYAHIRQKAARVCARMRAFMCILRNH